MSDLAEAAAQAAELAAEREEQQLAALRAKWQDELEAAARSSDYRERAVAFRAIGQFRYRQKLELLHRGLEDASPACRGSALISLDLLAREHPGVINSVRARLHDLAAHDDNAAVRRLAIVCLRHGSPQRETVLLLTTLAQDDEQDRQLRATAGQVAEQLRKRGATGKD